MAAHSSIPVWRIPWTGSLMGCSAWGCKDSDTSEATQHTRIHSLSPFAYTSLVYCFSILHEKKKHNVLESLKTHESTNIVWGGIYQNISQEKENAKLGSASSPVPSQSRFHITFLISVSTGGIICFWRDVNHLTVVLCHPLFSFRHEKLYLKQSIEEETAHRFRPCTFIFL